MWTVIPILLTLATVVLLTGVIGFIWPDNAPTIMLFVSFVLYTVTSIFVPLWRYLRGKTPNPVWYVVGTALGITTAVFSWLSSQPHWLTALWVLSAFLCVHAAKLAYELTSMNRRTQS